MPILAERKLKIMSSICYGGSVRMNPEVEIKEFDPWCDEGYPYKMPKVYLEGWGESYNRQYCFDWDEDSVVVVRDKRVIKYTRSTFVELLAKNEEGEIVWMDGRGAPYENCWKGEYLDEDRPAYEYTIEEYNLETSTKRKYKMVLEKETELDIQDYSSISNFVDVDKLGTHFKIEDGVLLSFFSNDTDLIIPDGVCEVGWNAFVNSREFESITFPRTLVKLPASMLADCKVKNIHISEDHPKYYVENGCLIDKESGVLVWGYAGNIIPNDKRIHSIGDRAFINREDIKNIVVPNNITEIGYAAFADCIHMESIMFSNPTCHIGERCLHNCKSLSFIKLPNYMKKIENSTFNSCISLESIEIPKTVDAIGDFAFSSCDGLKEVIVEESLVESIEKGIKYKLRKEGDCWNVDRTTMVHVECHSRFAGFSF